MFLHQALLANRGEAGRRLAERLLRCKEERPVVLALPRGGMPVANRTAFVMARGGAAG